MGGPILKSAGKRAVHDVGCVVPGLGVGDSGGGLVVSGQPNAGFRSPVTGALVGGSKAHAGKGISEGSSTISGALRNSGLGNVKLPGGRIYPAFRGYPWPGGGFGLTQNNRLGVLLGRWAPYAGVAGMVYGAFSLNACLSQ